MTTIEIHRDHLSAALRAAKDIVSAGRTIPILANVLLEARDGVLTITAASSDQQLSMQVACDGELLPFCVDHHDLAGAVAGLNGKAVQVERSGGSLTMKGANGGRRKLATLPADHWPTWEAHGLQDLGELDGLDLGAALAFAAPAVLVGDATYPDLGGVRLVQDGAQLCAVGLDGKRLHEARIDRPQPIGAPMILPPKLLATVRAVFPGRSPALASNGRLVMFSDGRSRLVGKLLEHIERDHLRMIGLADGHPYTWHVHAAELKRAVMSVSALVDEVVDGGKGRRIRTVALELTQGACEVRVRGQAECDEPIDGCAFDGPPLSVPVNAAFLLAALDGMGETALEVRVKDKVSAMLITAPDRPSRRVMLMPYRA